MACNTKPTACAPCDDCPQVDPIEPICNIPLPDGVYSNATVTVENGCIIQVEEGEPLVYRPDICCDTPSHGGGGANDDPCDCPPGEPGQDATIAIGAVSTVDPDATATVTNVGTPSNAILNIEIPRGQPGQDSDSVIGETDDRGGIEIENGVVKSLPSTWPPVLYVIGETDNVEVQLLFSTPNETTGLVTATLNIQTLVNTINQARMDADQALQDQISALQTTVANQQDAISSMQATIANIQATCC